MAGRPVKYVYLEEKLDAIRKQKREWYHRNKDKIKTTRPSKETIDMKRFSGYYMIRYTDEEEYTIRFSKNITQRCIQLRKHHPLVEYRILFFCDEANEATYNIAEGLMPQSIEESLNN